MLALFFAKFVYNLRHSKQTADITTAAIHLVLCLVPVVGFTGIAKLLTSRGSHSWTTVTDRAIEVSIMGWQLLRVRSPGERKMFIRWWGVVVIVITGRTGGIVVIVVSIGHHTVGCSTSGKAWKRHGTLG